LPGTEGGISGSSPPQLKSKGEKSKVARILVDIKPLEVVKVSELFIMRCV
tara:strand:- start:217 stop:366 length:150 start_codon:yes stop_codon:yes gene_type:complete